MKWKRIAIKGFGILAVVLCVSVLLSGTIRSMTTAKVKLLNPKNGKLEENIDLKAEVRFPDAVPLYSGVDEDIVIMNVDTRPGYTAGKDSILIRAEIADLDKKMDQLRKEYKEADAALRELERKNETLRIRNSDMEYVEAEFELQGAAENLLDKKIALEVLLAREGLTRDSVQAGAACTQECVDAMAAYDAALNSYTGAEQRYAKSCRNPIDETIYTYLTKKRELEDRIITAEDSMIQLTADSMTVAAITCPYDCYVADIPVKAGDVCGPKTPLLRITGEGSSPMLYADISDMTRTVSKNMAVTYCGRSYNCESKIASIATEDGKKYACIEIDPYIMDAGGSIYTMLQGEQSVKLQYKAQQSTCLLPVSALHGSDSDRYVYVVEKSENAFGAVSMTVKKTAVTVVNEVGATASIEEDLSWYTLAYMEDRALEDGCAVMEY